MRRFCSWNCVFALAACLFAADSSAAQSEQPSSSDKPTREPLFRVGRLPTDVHSPPMAVDPSVKGELIVDPPSSPPREIANSPLVKSHPLDPAIELANARLDAIRRDVADYQAIMVKRERIDGELNDPEFMKLKVRNRKQSEAGAVPFSVYMRFLKPKAVRGREVIYVEGQNAGKLLAHESGGLIGLTTFHLDPTGSLAMKSSRYPIYEAGIENLVVKLIEKAERDKAAGDCQVEFVDTAKINDRACTKITVTHPDRKAPYDFNVAEVFIDNELQVPIRYAAYSWPRKAGGEPELLEEYTYLNLELNVGLTAKDFDPSNPEYEYP